MSNSASCNPQTGPGYLTGSRGSDWNGYEWQVPLDELVDCDKCPTCCQRCYRYGKARPKWQKGLMVCFYLALIDIGIAFLFRYSVFSDVDFYLGPADQRLIKRGDDTYNLSPYLCSDYRLRLSDDGGGRNGSVEGFSTYGLSYSPPLSFERIDYVLRYPSVSLPPDGIHIMYHFLGSTATVILSACAPDRRISAYAVKSVTAMQNWETHECCGGFSDSFVFTECNSDGSSPNARRYSAYNGFSGDLFFVFTEYDNGRSSSDSDGNHHKNGHPASSAPLNITMLLQRHDYRWSSESVVDSCDSSSDCSLDLEEDNLKTVVAELSPSAGEHAKLRATCVPSVWGYFLYFAIIPLGITLAFTSIGVVLCLCQRQVNRLVEEEDRRRRMEAMRGASSRNPGRIPRSRWSFSSDAPLVGNRLDQDMWRGAGGNFDPPPSYDAVAVATISDTVGSEDPPPPYNSVTENI